MVKKKKISLFNISLASGGAEKVISLLLTKLPHDFEVTLVLMYDEIHFAIPPEINTIVLSNGPIPLNETFISKLRRTISFTVKYLNLIKQNDIDIAISFLALPNFINSFAKIRFPKLSTIISERGYPTDNTTSKISFYISKVFYPLLYNRNNKLFSNSVYINEDLSRNFGINIPMEVIYNPIEIPKYRVVQSETVSKNQLNIVNVGTLNERKNQAMIIDALTNLDGEFYLDIYGKGHLESSLNDAIQSAGLSNRIKLKGTVKNIYEHLVNYNCFVLSSNTEGFPNALLEAMAIGLPCISTNCLSGPLELLNGSDKAIHIGKGDFFKAKYGLLINNKDVLGLSKALTYYIENPLERKKYGELAYKKASEFEISCVYQQFKAFINS